MPLVRLITIFLVSLLVTMPAYAEVNETGKEKLTQIFTDWLDDFTGVVEGDGLNLDGELTVEMQEYYYSITMPHISVSGPEGQLVDIGVITFNAMPGENEGEWKMTQAFPSPIVVYGADKQPIYRFDIGGQNFVGVWSEELEQFAKFKSKYESFTGLNLSDQTGFEFAVPSFELSMVMDETSPDQWAGETKMEMLGAEVKVPMVGFVAKFDRIASDTNFSDYSMNAVDEYINSLSELASGSETQDGVEFVSESASGFFAALRKYLQNAIGEFAANVRVSGVDISLKAANPAEDVNVSVASGGVKFKGDNLKGESQNFNFGFGFEGLDGLRQGDTYEEKIVPSRAALEIDLRDFPMAKIIEQSAGLLQSIAAQPEMAGMGGLQLAAQLPKLMSDMGTRVELSDTYVGNDHYHVDVNGKVTASVEAEKLFVGQTIVDIAGLGKMIGMAQEQVSSGEISDEQKSQIGQLLAVMSVLQMTGKVQDNDALGRAVKRYVLELVQSGAITLNGADISTLIAGFGQSSAQ